MLLEITSGARRAHGLLLIAALGALLLTGCKGLPTANESEARQQLRPVAERFAGPAPVLPSSTNITLGELLQFALLKDPRIGAAYYDYAASVERITVERSLPDPRLAFELDIQDVVMTLMPGLMLEVPWMKRLRVRADVASAEAEAKYHVLHQAVLQTAYDVKEAYYRLFLLEQRLQIMRETSQLLGEIESTARALNQSGSATMQDVLRAQIEQQRLQTDIVGTEDSRGALMARYKAALGLGPTDSEPPLPATLEVTPATLPFDHLQEQAFQNNPRLQQMKAEIQLASSSIRLARLSRVPDFSLGVEADIKATPWMWRPSAGMTLPIWRDKIAAEIAGSQARKQAAEARLSMEQIQVAVEFAEASLRFRDATRTGHLLADQLLPKARQSLEVARSSYSTARSSFLDLLDAERQLLEFRLTELDARMERELAAVRLQLVLAAIPPMGAPLRSDTNKFTNSP